MDTKLTVANFQVQDYAKTEANPLGVLALL